MTKNKSWIEENKFWIGLSIGFMLYQLVFITGLIISYGIKIGWCSA